MIWTDSLYVCYSDIYHPAKLCIRASCNDQPMVFIVLWAKSTRIITLHLNTSGVTEFWTWHTGRQKEVYLIIPPTLVFETISELPLIFKK